MKNPALSDSSLIGTCLALAHATFYDALPSNAEQRGAIAPADLAPAKRAPSEGVLQRLANALDDWFFRQRLKEREAYLAQAQDVFDLERRMRELERRPYH